MTAFDRYLDRVTPDWLRQDAPVPPTWSGDETEWLALLDDARSAWRQRAAFAFVELVADKGWRTHEAVAGAVDRGREVSAVSGQVIQKVQPSEVDPALRRRAYAVLAEVERERVPIDQLSRFNVEQIAAGAFAGRGAEAHVSAVEAAVAAFHAEVRSRQRDIAEATVTIAVAAPFEALGRRFAAGEQHIPVALAEELDGWQERMAAQAGRIAGSGDPREAGIWHSAWPPYRVLQPAGADV